MLVFVTGATGYIGTVVVRDLLAAGHHVLGLTRSEEGADSLLRAGAQVHRGDLEDLDSLRAGAARADGVIHTAFVHDFSRFDEVCAIDLKAIEALASPLKGSDRPLVISSGTAMAIATPGKPSTEDDPTVSPAMFARAASEEKVKALAEEGVNASTVRLPQVHGREKQGLVTYAIAIAKEKGFTAYVGDGENRWPAAHRLDVARLYRLVLEKGAIGARYHAVAEEGVRARDIAEAIGRRFDLPVVSQSAEEAAEHFGWLAHFVGRDLPSSSEKTKQLLGWQPTQVGLLADLEETF